MMGDRAKFDESEPAVTVVIPTLAESSRFASLKRAVQSVRSSTSKAIQIIAVVNGDRFDANAVAWLTAQRDVTLVKSKVASLPVAQRLGRELVKTCYFSYLDDDDEYLPGATDRKLELLRRHADADYVVCNGYWVNPERLFYPGLAGISENPLHALVQRCWLTADNALFRTQSISIDFFHALHPYNEWTWLAFALCMAKKRLVVMDEPGYRSYPTPNSLSKSSAYKTSQTGLYERMLAASPPRHVAEAIRMRLSAAWHARSAQALEEGAWLDAARYHFRSLRGKNGLRYLSFSRRLVLGMPRR